MILLTRFVFFSRKILVFFAKSLDGHYFFLNGSCKISEDLFSEQQIESASSWYSCKNNIYCCGCCGSSFRCCSQLPAAAAATSTASDVVVMRRPLVVRSMVF